MQKYEARQCEEPNKGKWCICVDGQLCQSIGIFDSKGSAEDVIHRLINLERKVREIDAYAIFEIPIPANKIGYEGPIKAVVSPSDGCGYGIAQSLGCNKYALHIGEEFKLLTIQYQMDGVKITLPKTREREGKSR